MAEPVNIFTISSFFAAANERLKKGLNSYNSNRVLRVSAHADGIFRGTICASMKKKSYEVEVQIEDQEVKYASCECPIGKARCHHMAALLIWAEKNISRTDMECKWTRPKVAKEEVVVEKRVSKMAPSTTKAGISRPVTDSDLQWMSDNLACLDRFTGMKWIMSTEPAREVHYKTFSTLVSSQEFKDSGNKRQFIIDHMTVTPDEIMQIEKETTGQRENSLWFAYRKNRLTASNFGCVLAAIRRQSYPPSLYKTLLGGYSTTEGCKAIQWGVTHESAAISAYQKVTGDMVHRRGLVLSRSGLLGASPDGAVSPEQIVEIKCPWSARDTTILKVMENADFYLFFDDRTGYPGLKRNHKYYDQIQGNLHLTGAETCDLVVWCPNEMVVVPVQKDQAWSHNLTVLDNFYKDNLLSHII